MKSIIQFTDNFAGQPVKLWPPDRRGLFSGYTLFTTTIYTEISRPGKNHTFHPGICKRRPSQAHSEKNAVISSLIQI